MPVLGAVAAMGWFALGLVQYAATFAGLTEWIGLPWLLAAPITIFIAFLPVIGTLLGMLGAVHAWGWTWLDAGLLFVGPALVILLLAGAATWLDHRAKGD